MVEAKRKITMYRATQKLKRQLDSSLLKHASVLGRFPSIEQVYQLRGLAETHFLLVNRYRFTPENVKTLSRFADPLEVADQCRRISSKPDGLRISVLLDEMNAYMRYPLSDLENQ